MESAHIVKAHEHVRNAATATYGNSVATAGQEHEFAAASFHDAAQDTHNAEALRILGLLEDHHLKLARLIKEPPRKEDKSHDATKPASDNTESPPPKAPAARTTSPNTSSPTRAPSRRRLPQSSIASNLAEKRGIPGARRGVPSASQVTVTNALASRNARQPTTVTDLLQQQARKTEEVSKYKDETSTKGKEAAILRDISPPPDDNFHRFYSAFGGVINAISAPLAFTSLPLNPALPSATTSASAPTSPEETKPKPKPKTEKTTLERSHTIKSSEPDLISLISKPALQALREDQTGPLGPFANNESFYFVPTSGGTVSYANILRDPTVHPHHAAQDPHLDSIAEGDNEGTGLKGSSHEEFVDARESIGPPSPTTSRRPHSKGSSVGAVASARERDIRAGSGKGVKTMEELALENETLRSLIDKQAKRLSMWETTSQSSYNALAQSFRARGGAGLKQQLSDPSALAQALAMGSGAVPALPSPPMAPQVTTPSGDLDKERQAAQKIADLEAMLASATAELERGNAERDQLMRQNEKNTQVIGRYREQWEKLKAGARKKEQERREKRLAEIKAGEQAKDSESGENEVEEPIEEDASFGKA